MGGSVRDPLFVAEVPVLRRRRTRKLGTELDLGDPASFPCRRTSPRLQDPELEGVLHRHRQAQLIDLGGGGFRVESSEPLRRSADYRVRFCKPGVSLRYAAELVWTRLVRTEQRADGNVHPVYAAGFRYPTSLDAGQRRTLGEFVKEFAERPVAHRKPPRYAMRGGTRAELIAAVPFTVRELSLSGMLVESAGLEEVAGDRFAVTLGLPAAPLELAARVVGAGRRGGSTRAGIAFDALSAQQSEALDGFLTGQL